MASSNCCVRELTYFWQTITFILCCKCCCKPKEDDEFDTRSVEYTVRSQPVYDNSNIEAELNIEMSALDAYQRSAQSQNQIPIRTPPVVPPRDPALDIANKTYMGIFMTELNQKWDHLAVEKQSKTNASPSPYQNNSQTCIYPPLANSQVQHQINQEPYSDERTTRQAPYNFAYNQYNSWDKY